MAADHYQPLTSRLLSTFLQSVGGGVIRKDRMKQHSPTKRKSSGSSSKEGTAKVKMLVENSFPAHNPVVVSFPGGLPESLQEESTTVEHPIFRWEKLNPRSALGRKVSGKDKHCTYSAYAKGLGYDDRNTKLCVGVYDKKRGVVMIREAACRGSVFALQQAVPAYLEKNGTVQPTPGSSLLSYSTQVFEDFGSAKKQKVLRSQAANRVDINHVVGAGVGSAVMQQVIQGESMSESNRKAIAESKANGGVSMVGNRAVDAAHEVARRNLLPAYDENAIKPDKVYDARDIAGDKAWMKIFNKVHACSHKDDVSQEIIDSIFEKDWNPSVVKIVKAISPDRKDFKDRYTCAILANWLIRFYTNNQSRRTIPPPNETKATYFGIPIEVASRWVSLFTTSVPGHKGIMTHAMSKQDKDKCLIHALLLFMMSQGVAMKISDLKPIAHDLKKPVNDCALLLRQAGCQVTKKGTSLAAALKTPLTFPPPRRAVNKGN